MISSDQAKVILQFLDRAEITGHQERAAMNNVTEVLHKVIELTNPVDKKEKEVV